MPNNHRAEAPAAGEELKIRAGDGIVSVRALGRGRPIVLLHSLLADRTSFEPLAALLVETHKVFMPDLPGFGGSQPVMGGLEAVADRVADTVDDLERIEQPTLVMAGRHDPICSPTATWMLSRGLPHATTEIFEDASHFFLMEQPEPFNRLLLDWLQRHSR